MKKILIISLLIAILSLSTVAAQENSTDIIDIVATQDVSDEIITDEANDEILNEDINDEIITGKANDEILNEDINDEIITGEANDEILNEDINDEIITENAPNNVLKENQIYGIHLHSRQFVKGLDDLITFIMVDASGEMSFDKMDIYVDGNFYSKFWYSDGTGTPFAPGNYPLGEHVISIKYEGDKFVFKNFTFEVVEYLIDIPNTMDVNVPGGISIDISDNVTGTATAYINGSRYDEINLTHNYNEIYFRDLGVGTYEIKVVYSGDESHPEATEIKIMNVTYIFRVNTNADDHDYYAKIHIPGDIKNDPIVTIDGKTYSFEMISNYSSGCTFQTIVNLSELDPGIHYLNVTYPGDEKYPQRTILKEFEVAEQNSTPIQPVEPTTPVDENKQNYTPTIYFKKEVVKDKDYDGIPYYYVIINGVPENESENIRIYVDNVYVTNYGISDGIGITIPACEYPLGEHVITAVYDGNSEYNPFAINTTFKVIPYLITIPDEIDIDSQEYVKIEASNSVTGTAAVYVNGTECGNITLSKLNYVPLNNLKCGIYEIKVVYSGNEYHPEATETKIVNVTYKFQVDTQKDDYNYNATVTLPKDVKNTPIATIEGKTYPFEKINSTFTSSSLFKVSIDLSKLESGDYYVNITYLGDEKYPLKTVLKDFNINKSNIRMDPKITAKNTKVLYTANGKYTVTVYGEDGELASGVEVIFTINGKQVAKVKTTNKGTATYTVTKNPGTYKITTSALGAKNTKTLTVKHIVTLKKVTPKKSAKKLVLTATLAKVNGKYLKNKQITFKFKGKTYKAKTNKKGVAKVTIKSSVLKKLKVGKKITYQATYKKDTVKQTVKIKK